MKGDVEQFGKAQSGLKINAEWMVFSKLRISLRSKVLFPVPTSPVMTMKPFFCLDPIPQISVGFLVNRIGVKETGIRGNAKGRLENPKWPLYMMPILFRSS